MGAETPTVRPSGCQPALSFPGHFFRGPEPTAFPPLRGAAGRPPLSFQGDATVPGMESRYDAEGAARMVHDLAARASEPLAMRTYSARLIGSDASLVLHGGGNTSVKATGTTLLGETIEVLHIKGSGWDLATIEPEGHPAVRLEPLRRLRALDAMTDEAMVNELRTNLLDASAPTPSVETLLHAFLPARFVDHTHADAILALADQPDGKRIFSALFGKGLVWIPYVMPGFALAKRCIAEYERVAAQDEPVVMVLERHGLLTWGATAEESYARTIDAVSRAEGHAADRRGAVTLAPTEIRSEASQTVTLPRLRGILGRLAGDLPERGPIVRTRATQSILAFLERRDVAELVARGCATPDHVLRTKPSALLLQRPAYADAARLGAQLEGAVEEYARKYNAYFEEMCRSKKVKKNKLDPWPRIVLLPGFGACSAAATAREADVALDVYEHTIEVMVAAAEVGSYAPCSRSDLFDVEYWSLEQAKIKAATPAPLARSVALVTGAASGIGLATVERLLGAGAHVAMVDRDFDALATAAEQVARGRKERVLTVVADVREDDQVTAAVARTVAAWGGLDVVVSNAGTAPEGRLETEVGEAALRESMEVNCLAHARVARRATEVMSAQGRGGCLLFNASKAAFNPGPGFGPYAVAKTALLGLMRQYAVDLGAQGIRSNAVNADRIRTHLFAGGVVESRARARGLSVDDYFKSNLLAREVSADDVAGAFVYLAGAQATTGCVVTVDGGNAAAFPR
jgi:rhamnose utilization protein RhaD (predicted bifunctional aldolase and dehydrogenase)/NAD(P)-dependent dehydrogenase (short-subunit alcohol dehydrogenase family)